MARSESLSDTSDDDRRNKKRRRERSYSPRARTRRRDEPRRDDARHRRDDRPRSPLEQRRHGDSGRPRQRDGHERRTERDRRERSVSPPRKRDDERRAADGVNGSSDTRLRRANEGGAPGQDAQNANEAEAPAAAPETAPTRKAPAAGRAGGVYIPPFKLAAMMAELSDKSGPEYQRMTWDALRKSINGLINKVNTTNIKNILPELFGENLIRGRGLFCRSLMKAQMASPPFTPVYAALVAVVNTKFPELGELLLHRVVLQFRRAYKRNDKPICVAVTQFLAQLTNQGVVHEVLALELLLLLLAQPSDDSVEVAVNFTKEVGAYLQDVASKGLQSAFERFRAILHEGEIDTRVQFMIESLFAIRKAGFAASGHPALPPALDLVEAEDQITHELSLQDELDAKVHLDVFKFDPEYDLHEKQYAAISREILGLDSDEEEEGNKEGGGEGESDEESDEDDDEDDQEGGVGGSAAEARQDIIDQTQTNLVNLRRTIYLTIMSSMDFEEAGHKLLKINVPAGQEIELVTMIIECCCQERSYMRYYGLLAQRFCMLDRKFQDLFEDCFRKQYSVIHRLETNKLRNVAKLFAHLLCSDALPWSVFLVVRITEADTTSSSRIFIKHLFQEMSETWGLVKLNQRLQEPACQEWFSGLFPKDSVANMRFAINFFTSIGLGGITDKMREEYKQLQVLAAEQKQKALEASSDSSSSDSDSGSDSSSDDSSSSSSGSGSSDSDSDSESSDSDSSDDRRKRAGKKHKSRR